MEPFSATSNDVMLTTTAGTSQPLADHRLGMITIKQFLEARHHDPVGVRMGWKPEGNEARFLDVSVQAVTEDSVHLSATPDQLKRFLPQGIPVKPLGDGGSRMSHHWFSGLISEIKVPSGGGAQTWEIAGPPAQVRADLAG